MSEPLVSLLILNYNHSKIDPAGEIEGKYEKVKYVRSEENLGFTGGNNLAYRHSSGDYIFIVNNDTELTPDILQELLKPFSQERVGIVCPKIRFYDKPEVIQYAGFNPINPYTGRNSAVGSKAVDRGQFDIPGPTHYAHGAAMLVPRKIIEEVGLFPDFFFIYYEELDFSERVKKAGFSILYQPSALIFHKESITMGKESPVKVYYMNRNRILFMRRNTELRTFIVFLAFLVFLTIPKNTLKYILRFEWAHLRSFYRAVGWNLFNKSIQK